LAGKNAFRFTVAFDSAAEFSKARATYKRELFALNDLAHQYLLRSGRTLFKGMAFEDLRRMQVDIETFTGTDGAMSDASRDPLLAIVLSDSTGWEEILVVDDPNDEAQERAVLEKFVALVRERDPDVIEGHNIFRFDLPYLETSIRSFWCSSTMLVRGSWKVSVSRPRRGTLVWRKTIASSLGRARSPRRTPKSGRRLKNMRCKMCARRGRCRRH
jgi:hypothetical protein